jgi:transcription elongation factor Elf1
MFIHIFINMDKTKTCSICGLEKSITEFYKSQRTKKCINCFLIKNKEIKKKLRNNDEYRKFEGLQQRERRFRLWQNTLINDSKRKNIEHDLTVFDIDEIFEKQNGLCYWFNVPLIPSKKSKNPQQPSLDRLNRDLGYTKDNVVLTCYSANIGRNENTVEEWEIFLKILKININK